MDTLRGEKNQNTTTIGKNSTTLRVMFLFAAKKKSLEKWYAHLKAE
jgi:hypothetical protein